MSWRSEVPHPASPIPRTKSSAANEALLCIGHLMNVMRLNALEKPGCFRKVEPRVAGLDAQEKAVRGGAGEALYIEYRMIGLRQLVERQHANHREGGCPQNRQFKRDGNECRPAV